VVYSPVVTASSVLAEETNEYQLKLLTTHQLYLLVDVHLCENVSLFLMEPMNSCLLRIEEHLKEHSKSFLEYGRLL
jgi:hypothetical protein